MAVLSKPGCVDEERIGPGGRVAEAGDAVYGPFERTSPSGRILVADVVAKERVEPGSCVVVSGHVFIERTLAVGRVVIALVGTERTRPSGRVVAAGLVVKERTLADGRVEEASCVVRERPFT